MSPATLSPEAVIAANVELGRRFFAEQDRLRGGPAEALCAEEYRATIGGNPPMDRAAHEQFAVGFYGAFGDARHDIEEVWATEDRVAVRFVIRGTHTGSFYGIPATQRAITTVANVFLQVADGQVHTLKAVFDQAGLVQQITG